MYTVIEMQTNNGTTVVLPPAAKETREEAESTWHQIMAAAAISSVEIHTAVILNAEGQIIRTGCYKHQVAE